MIASSAVQLSDVVAQRGNSPRVQSSHRYGAERLALPREAEHGAAACPSCTGRCCCATEQRILCEIVKLKERPMTSLVVHADGSTIRRATLLEAPQPPVDARLELWPYAGGTVDSLKLERPIAKE